MFCTWTRTARPSRPSSPIDVLGPVHHTPTNSLSSSSILLSPSVPEGTCSSVGMAASGSRGDTGIPWPHGGVVILILCARITPTRRRTRRRIVLSRSRGVAGILSPTASSTIRRPSPRMARRPSHTLTCLRATTRRGPLTTAGAKPNGSGPRALYSIRLSHDMHSLMFLAS